MTQLDILYFPVSDSSLTRMRERVDVVAFGELDIMPDSQSEEIAGLEVIGCLVHQPEYHA